MVCNVVPNKTLDYALWHSRLGQVPDKVLKLLCNKLSLNFKSPNSHDCLICPLSKFRRLSFVSHDHYSAETFDLVHVDTWGPYHHPTHDGKRYFLTIVDDCSRFTWVYLLQQKSEAPHLIKSFFKYVLTNVGKTIKQLRSDNAKELQLTEFLQEHGTLHQFICPNRPEQNSVVKIKHQHLLNVARSLLFQSKVPIQF